jgi:hypothetical protein
MDGKTQAAAAAASGMSLRTAREWATGPAPSATKRPRDWRTRPDPFATVWLTDVEPLLRSDLKGVLEAKWVLDVLQTRYPEQFHAGQARTLQRRFRDWRARHGVEPEVFLEQVAVAGREAAIDFTHAADLGVTITGDRFRTCSSSSCSVTATGPGGSVHTPSWRFDVFIKHPNKTRANTPTPARQPKYQ